MLESGRLPMCTIMSNWLASPAEITSLSVSDTFSRGCRLLEIRDRRGQMVPAKTERPADIKRSGHFARSRSQGVDQAVQILQQGDDSGVEEFAFFGQAEAARAAVGQLHAEAGLQLPQPLRDRRRRHVQPPRGLRQRSAFGDRDEKTQVGDVVRHG